MTSIRAQAEILYDTAGNYDSVCIDTAGVVKQLTAAYAAAGVTYALTCYDSATAWAAAAPLKGGGAFCVDSTGVARSVTAANANYVGVTGVAPAALVSAATACN